MKAQLRRIYYWLKATFFTLLIHGAVVYLVVFGLDFESKKPRSERPLIQATVISQQQLEQRKAVKVNQLKQLEHNKKLQQAQQRLALNKKQEQAKQKKIAAANKRKAVEEKKRELEAENKRKAEAEKKRELEAEKKRKQAEQKRLKAQALQDQLKQQRRQLKLEAERAFERIQNRIQAVIQSNWREPDGTSVAIQATLQLKVSASGEVLNIRITKSSGDRTFDESVEKAVLRASPLPFPANPKYYDIIKEFELIFNPYD